MQKQLEMTFPRGSSHPNRSVIETLLSRTHTFPYASPGEDWTGWPRERGPTGGEAEGQAQQSGYRVAVVYLLIFYWPAPEKIFLALSKEMF